LLPISLHSAIGVQLSSIARAQDSVAALQSAHVPLDSIRVQSPLPGGVAQVVRFLLTTVPPWIQIGGVVLAVVVGALILGLLITRRQIIRNWLATRSTAIKVAIAVVAVVIIAAAGTAGAATWNYTQHSNDFCQGCHVMDVAVERMSGGESKHAKLACHSCHQQSLAASAWQVYLWVSERPEKIEKHAKVPNGVCENCHVTKDTAGWQRIASTAGHRVHLESDSSALKNVTCVKCHGTELHHFEPAKQTCGQSGCHKPEETTIKLAKMSGQTIRHCTVCHQFTTQVPALATRDSASGTLVPGAPQCLGCHQMRTVLADFDAAKDPHGGKCGTCHNPHTQKTPIAAANSCATSGCHANWRDTPFHVGASHRRVGSQCLTCHVPHAAKVDASQCEGCHLSVRSRGKSQPPLPFDTTKALRRSEANATPKLLAMQSRIVSGPVRVAMVSFEGTASQSGHDMLRSAFEAPRQRAVFLGVGPPASTPPEPDKFPHARHEKIACLVCHATGDAHGRLTFEAPRGCAICHHQAPASARCASCHRTAEYSAPKQMTAVVTVAGHEPKPRSVEFLHARHAKRTCIECHTTPVSLEPSKAKAECRDCHEDHHAAGRTCSTCHAPAQPATAHKTLETAHQRCDACHTATTVARLTPTRSFCGTCHTAKTTNHYDAKECTVCHFLADPAAYRSKLVTQSRAQSRE
jgi:hypothetical protein